VFAPVRLSGPELQPMGAKMRLIRKFMSDRQGATAIEYGLIAAIMSIALISGFGAFSNSLQNTFSTVESSVTNAGK
jgi:pilus assembly protein Flp/PilA